ncbi:MAG: hypothetical protein GY745_08515 [Actinomycetia bacterium]|nr:hypothetical protein [Actinomycetes bacterium]MCP4085077.1 hypothetical protein [Actinomycetes bacterium]
MHINQIATRITNRSDHRPGEVDISHPYRRRWWLPVIGPTATVLVDHLATVGTGDWQIHDTTELATALGLGRGTGLHSPLIRTLERLTRFGFGTFDIAPGHPHSDPCLSVWRTIGLVPERVTQGWPQAMQQAHAIDLVALHRAAA